MAGKREKPAKKNGGKRTDKPAPETGDFPRGGASALTALELREVSRQAENDVLFSDGVLGDKRRGPSADGDEPMPQKKKMKKKARAKAGAGLRDGQDGVGDVVDEEHVAPVESLSIKKLTKGALVLGCVAAIRELELRVALPNGLSGTVPITSISPELTALVEKAAAEADDSDDAMDVDSNDDPLDLQARFSIGQFVKCVVADVTSDKARKGAARTAARIELSLLPEEINSRIDPSDICEGLVLTASVKSVEDRGYVLNTGLPGESLAAFLPATAAQPWIDRWMPQATELKPGQLVEAAVSSISDDRRSLRLTIDPATVAHAAVKETYKTMASVQPGQLVSATIMKVWDRGLSLRFMGFYDCSADLNAIGMLTASGKKAVEEKYTLGDTVQVRILYVSLTAAAKVIIVEQLFTIEDVQPGALVDGTVKCYKENGVDVTLSSTLQGFIHKVHLSDVALKHPELQFTVGKKVRCRVLKVLRKQNSILLTSQKTLVQSKLPAVTGYTEAEGAVPGAIVQGVVDRAVGGGVIANFYQGVHAFVATSSKRVEPGKSIKCRILTCNASLRRMRATDNIDPETSLDDLITELESTKRSTFSSDVSQVAVGQIVSGAIARVGESFVTVLLDGSSIGATLPVGHLSDHRGATVERIAAQAKVGTRLDKLVVVSINTGRSRVTVSAKPALISAATAGSITTSASSVTVGATLVGWVKGMTSFGVFIAFPGSVSALVPLEQMSDRYISSPSDIFAIDQTVIAVVTSVGDQADGGRIYVSLKASAVDISATKCIQPADFLLAYFDELESASGAAQLGEIGQVLQVKVKQKHPYGVLVSPAEGSKHIPSSSSGFITAEQAKDRVEECTEGAVLPACVLDMDPEKDIVDYSLRTALVPQSNGTEKKAKKKGKAAGAKRGDDAAVHRKALESAVHAKKETQAVVEVIKEDYLVLSLPLLGNAIAFALTKSYNDRSKPFMRFKAGQVLNGTPVRAEQNRRTLVLLQPAPAAASGQAANGSSATKRTVTEPVDPAINFFEDYQPGVLTQARVKSIKGMQANLDLAANAKGRLHITELFDGHPDMDVKSAADVFAAAGVRTGEVIQVKVLGWHDAKVYKFLPITHRTSPLKTVIETTVRPSELATSDESATDDSKKPLTWKSIKPGHVVHGFVASVKCADSKGAAAVRVSLGLSLLGVLPILAATSDYAIAAHASREFPTGMPIEVQVFGVDKKNKVVYVAPHGNYIPGVERPLGSPGQLVPGARVVASIDAVMESVAFAHTYVVDQAAGDAPSVHRISCKIDMFDAVDTLTEKPLSTFKKGQLVRAIVTQGAEGDDVKAMKIRLSTRPSVVTPDAVSPQGVADPVIETAADVKVGQVVHGFVKQTTQVGCFVALGRNTSGRALISELSDEYIRDVKGAFPAGKFVTAVVTGVDTGMNRISLSLRPSKIGASAGPDGEKKRRLDQLGVGEVLKGTITRIEDYGVFVRPDDAFTTGLCYVREIADSETPIDPKALYEIGDRVLAKVLKVDLDAGRLALGLKSSYFAEDESSEDSSEGSSEEDSEDDSDAEESSDEEDGSDEDSDAEETEDESSGSDASSVDDSDAESDASDNGAQALPVSGGFRWGDDDDDDNDDEAEQPSADESGSSDEDGSSSDSDDEAAAAKKNGKRSKMQRVTQDITADLSEQAPRTANDFERLVMGSPHSSFIWIQFMTFYLGQSEIDQAREVAERALRTIPAREEQEKMNVWVALLNLEHRFGGKELLADALKRAVQYMNPKHVYLQMAKIHERADQFAEAERMHKVAVSKFSGSCKVWVLFGLLYLKNGKLAESRDLLARALRSLPKRKHIKAITQFGQMEFRYGEPERGRTVFEGVLNTYPKRVDLWSVYLDMEISTVTRRGLAGDDHCWDPARKLFERVASMRFSSKKVKFFFKKWLKFEKDHGTDGSIEHVKQRAREYVNSLAA
ncbi:rRNA biogenesis protein rrp5 [Coemansia sp. RSA 552]|nr:rRNA biogenesis protein rrp5 [Coemansia sp. RSA 552]